MLHMNKLYWKKIVLAVMTALITVTPMKVNGYNIPDGTLVWDDCWRVVKEGRGEEVDPDAGGIVHRISEYGVNNYKTRFNYKSNVAHKWWPSNIESSRGPNSSVYEENGSFHFTYSVIKTIECVKFLNEIHYFNFPDTNSQWFETYLKSNFYNCHFYLSNLADRTRNDGREKSGTYEINNMKYIYTYDSYDGLMAPGTPYENMHHQWVNAVGLFGDYMIEVEFAWSDGIYGLTDMASTMEKLLSTIHFPTVDSGRDKVRTDEDPSIDPLPSRTDVELISSIPENGSKKEEFQTKLNLTFSRQIEKINFDGGYIYLVNSQDDTVVMKYDLAAIPAASRNLYVQKYRDTLTVYLPTKATHEAMSSFCYLYPNAYTDTGKSYYLKMDKGVLTFKGTGSGIELGAGEKRELEYTVVGKDYLPEAIIKEGTFEFASSEQFQTEIQRTGTADFYYNSQYFFKNSSDFNPQLARLSMDMALAAYGNTKTGFGPGDYFIRNFLTGLGVDNLATNEDYNKPSETHTTGVAVASQKISDDTTLLIVAVRGGNYGREWGGNFIVGFETFGPDHEGFAKGRDNALAFLKSFVTENGITGKVKIWLAGYSRASAIANLTAAKLADNLSYLGDQITYTPEDIFGYGFEVPASTTSPYVNNTQYNGIYSIVNPTDLVPRVPLWKWGFNRYGKVVLLLDPSEKEFRGTQQDVIQRFWKIYGYEIGDKQRPKLTDTLLLNAGFGLAAKIISERDDFAGIGERIAGAIATTFLSGESTFGESIKVISGLVGLHKAETISDLINKMALDIQEIKDKDAPTLLISHYAEYTLSWIEILEEAGKLKERVQPYSNDENTNYYRTMVEIKCPVNVEVYTDGGEKVAQIIDGYAKVYGDGIDAEMKRDEDIKQFIFSSRQELVFKIKATDQGKMNIIITAKGLFDNEVNRMTNYYNLDLVKDQTYTLTMDSGERGNDYIAELKDSKDQVIKVGLDAKDGVIPEYTITTHVIGKGKCTETAKYKAADRVTLYAQADEGDEFLGWYVNGELYSSDAELFMVVGRSWDLEARFTDKEAVRLQQEMERREKMLKTAGIVGAIAVVAVGSFLFLKTRKRKTG